MIKHTDRTNMSGRVIAVMSLVKVGCIGGVYSFSSHSSSPETNPETAALKQL